MPILENTIPVSLSSYSRKMVDEKWLTKIEKMVGQRQKNGLPEMVGGSFIMSKMVDEKWLVGIYHVENG